MDWLIENWASVAGIAAAVVLVFDRLAKLTPTNSDNAWVERLQRLFALIGLKVSDNEGAKE